MASASGGTANPVSGIVSLLSLTTFLSAVLLFLVQPMFGKMILPFFGGAPEVWITSLVFFQVTLLAGYLYVHITHKWLGLKKQVLIQVMLLLLPLAVLPVRVLSDVVPTSPYRPIASVFLVLLVSVGLPFFVVSTTAPLLQRWLADTTDPRAHDPFFLYAASNLGSLGALIAYPLIVEPRAELSVQSRTWTFAYVVLIALVIICGVAALRSRVLNARPDEKVFDSARTPWPTRLRWIALAAVPSSLMLSVTVHITTDVAAVPLLWVIPLAIYLGTYVLAFSRRTVGLGRFAAAMLPFVALIPVAIFLVRMQEPLSFMLFHVAALTVAAIACHSQLAMSRPPAERLTEFYVWLSVGGAVGGVFNVLIAPLIFRTEIEYPLALVLACVLTTSVSRSDWRVSKRDIAIAATIAIVTLGAEYAVEFFRVEPRTIRAAFIVLLIPAGVALAFRRKPVRFALVVAAFAIVAGVYPDWTQATLASSRSFFGIYHVVNSSDWYRTMLHGKTNHGAQSLIPKWHCTPLTYYFPTGPLGDLFSTSSGPRAKSSIGVVGLGVGSIGGYAQPGQRWTFYEIDPEVERLARDERYFTFLRDCVPQAKVVLGDGRLSLSAQPDAMHDLIIVDAFSSDAIPVHLLTREAFAIYNRKLARGGVLAFHISNRFSDLKPVLARQARDAGLVAFTRSDGVDTDLVLLAGKKPSVWVMMARSAQDLGPISNSIERGWLALDDPRGGRVWTDSYSNVLSTLRW